MYNYVFFTFVVIFLFLSCKTLAEDRQAVPQTYSGSSVGKGEAPNVVYRNADGSVYTQNIGNGGRPTGYIPPQQNGVAGVGNNIYTENQQPSPVYNNNVGGVNNGYAYANSQQQGMGGVGSSYTAQQQQAQPSSNTYGRQNNAAGSANEYNYYINSNANTSTNKGKTSTDSTPKALKLDRIEMPRHSFETSLTFENTLNEWDIDMDSIRTKQHFVLTPAVANRTGQFWNKSPVNTNQFEISFTFEVKGVDTARPEGFAFWYVHEEYAKTYPKTVEEKRSWNLFGYKGNFKGLGIFFSVLDKSNTNIKPSVSALYTSPYNNIIYNTTNIPSPDGIYYKFRNTHADKSASAAHIFKLTVTKNSIIGQIRASTSNQYLPCFHLQNVDIQPGGFIGFTAYTGPETLVKGGGEGGTDVINKMSDMIIIRNLQMHNLDLNIPTDNGSAENINNILTDNEAGGSLKHFHLKELTDEVKKLSRLIYKSIAEQAPRDQNVLRSLNSLSASFNQVVYDVKEMKKNLQFITGMNHTDVMHSMKSELTGLKTLIHRHSQHHANTLHSLSSTLDSKLKTGSISNEGGAELRELAQNAARLEEVINRRGFDSLYSIFAVIIALFFFALFVWKKFRDINKKHYL